MPSPGVTSITWDEMVAALPSDWAMPAFTTTPSQIIRGGRVDGSRLQPRAVSTSQVDSQEDGETMLVSEMFGLRPDNSTVPAHPLVNGVHRVGVEIELENITTRLSRSSRYWRQIEDGSLRNNGAEFIFSAPYGGVDLFHAVVEIDSHLHALKPDANVRCSTHVHVDVRDMNAQQIKYMILAYMVMERILFRCSGWHRYRNNFCIALGFAESMIRVLSSNWHHQDRRFAQGVVSGWDKYTAINLLPMRDKGSIEFRISEPKWRKGQLLRLCNRFLALKEIAMSWTGSETDLVLHLASTHPSQVLRKGFLNKIDVQPSDLDLGAKMAMDIINLSKIPRTAPDVRLECRPDILCDGPDGFFSTGRVSRTWTSIRDSVANNEDLMEIFGNVFQDPLPSTLTYSFLYQVSSYFPISVGNWFADSSDIVGYEGYRAWFRENGYA